jgi:hypothetical protein
VTSGKKIAEFPDQKFVAKSGAKTPPARLSHRGSHPRRWVPGGRKNAPRDPPGATAHWDVRDSQLVAQSGHRPSAPQPIGGDLSRYLVPSPNRDARSPGRGADRRSASRSSRRGIAPLDEQPGVLQRQSLGVTPSILRLCLSPAPGTRKTESGWAPADQSRRR